MGLRNTNYMHGHVDALQTTQDLALRADFWAHPVVTEKKTTLMMGLTDTASYPMLRPSQC